MDRLIPMGHMEGSRSCSKLRLGSAYSAVLGIWDERPPLTYRKLEIEQEREMSLESCPENGHADVFSLIVPAKDSHPAAPCQQKRDMFHPQWEESQSSMSKAQICNSIRAREWKLGSSIHCCLGDQHGHHHSTRTPSWSLFDNRQSANLITCYVLKTLRCVRDVRICTPQLVLKDLLLVVFSNYCLVPLQGHSEWLIIQNKLLDWGHKNCCWREFYVCWREFFVVVHQYAKIFQVDECFLIKRIIFSSFVCIRFTTKCPVYSRCWVLNKSITIFLPLVNTY